MHYYAHHIGDLLKDTSHLSNEQLAVYMRLLWKYYLDEKPLENNLEMLAFAMRSDEKTVRLLLNHYFKLDGEFWRQTRCDKEIKKYHSKSEKAMNSANARWSKADAMRTHTERNANDDKNYANQEPITNNHNNTTSESEIHDCPHDELIDLFSKKLPTLSQPRKSLWLKGKNAPALKARWRWVMTECYERGERRGLRMATTKSEGLAWFERFFGYVADSDFLMGRTPKPFNCDFGWLVNAANFEKVVQGNYENKEKSA